MPTHFYIAILAITGLWMAWMAYWAISGMGTKRNVYVQPYREQLPFRLCILAAILCMQSIPGLRYRLVPPYPALEIAGIALCTLGLLFAVWARVHIGRNWSALVTVKEDHELVTTGPYAWIRHPIYTGVLTAILGTALALSPSIGGCIAVPLAVFAFWLRLRQEEVVMQKQFPGAYVAYKARVRAAIIPFIL